MCYIHSHGDFIHAVVLEIAISLTILIALMGEALNGHRYLDEALSFFTFVRVFAFASPSS